MWCVLCSYLWWWSIEWCGELALFHLLEELLAIVLEYHLLLLIRLVTSADYLIKPSTSPFDAIFPKITPRSVPSKLF